MKKACRKTNSKLEELRQELKVFATTVEPGSKEYKTRLNTLRLVYTGPGGSVTSEMFQKALQEAQIDATFVETEHKADVTQLQNPSLAFKNLSTLYRNATSALGFMRHDFNIRMFKALFLDNTNYGTQTDARGKLLNDTITRVPLTSVDVNGNIVKLKNDLIKIIADEFNLPVSTPVFQYAGVNSIIDQVAYKNLLTNAQVTSWLAKVNANLQTADTHTLQVHSALMILNNFDDLVSEYLPKILTVSKKNYGYVTNVTYTKELEGNAPSIWSVDDLVTYGSDLYASNLGKFILGTINKVDADLKPIEGAFMSPQDAFVIASLLREAEYEYHILKRDTTGYPYNQDLTFKSNLTETVKVLLKMGLNDELDCLKRYKREIFPVYNWLYNTDDNTIASTQIYSDLFKSGKVANVTSVLNLASVLEGEIIKNAVPVYLETTAFNSPNYKGPIRTINVSHTFRGTSYLTQNLRATIFDEMRVDRKNQNTVLNGQVSKEQLQALTVEELLSKSGDAATALTDAFEELFGIPLTREVLQGMRLGKIDKAKTYVEDVICKIGELFRGASSHSEDQRESLFNESFNRTFIQKEADFKNKYTTIAQAVADRKVDLPLTIIKNSEGKSIPIYRLGSTIFEDIYLINQLKRDTINRRSRNFFIENTHALSNINNPFVKAGTVISHNNAYQGATGLRLETISDIGTNAANNSSGKEAYLNSFFGDFLGLGTNPDGHSISVQLMTLSDKASIFTKIINLDAIVLGYDTNVKFGENGKSLDNMTNQELEDMYYFFRKNQVTDEIFHIIETWNKLLNLNINIPVLDHELLNGNQMLQETSDFIQKTWQQINTELEVLDIKTAGAKGVEKLIRDYQINHPGEQISLTKDLHYSFYDKKVTLNKNIYFHYKQVRSKQTFTEQINKYVARNTNHPWYASLTALVSKTQQAKDLLKTYCANHNFNYVDTNGIPQEVLRRKIILDAFFRSQIMDFHFKGPQLDAVKNIKDYDEETDDQMNIIEADAKFKAAGKRTVDLGGTKQNFAQGLIDGVSSEVWVAHIEEPKVEVWSPSGVVEDGLEVLNGSGRISYIYAMMESASMTGSPFKGINRKTLGEHVDNYYSTLYKWAEYLINNWHMRNSTRSHYKLEQLFRKMHDMKFDEEINLTESFLKPGKLFTPEQANNGKPVFFASGLHYYKLNKLTYKGNNTYDVTLKEVNEYGDELLDPYFSPDLVQTQDVKIESLYDLFKVLGGTESMSLNEDGKLSYSNASLQMLYNYVVNVGTVTDPNYTELNQSVVRQPLRDKFIAIAASNSGIKRGETNTNSKQVYTDSQLKLLKSRIRTALFGAQMDVYHHIDNESESTEPTQTLAALATNGNTREEANKVYNAIASIIQSNMRDIARASNTVYDEDNATKIVKELSKDIVSVINENGSNLQASLIELCQTYLGGMIPLSDTTFYNAFHSYNIQQLNKLALRRKYSGMGGVLNPSSQSYQIFTIGKQHLEYDDLVKRARENFAEYTDLLGNLSTEQIADLYLYSETDEGKQNNVQTLLQKGMRGDTSAIRTFQAAIANVRQNTKIESGEQIHDGIVNACSRKITTGEAEPLDTVFVNKNGSWYKVKLDTAKAYFDILNNTDIIDIRLDITTPHDLKPQIVKYKYNGETHSLYESTAGALSYQLNTMYDSDSTKKEFDDLVESLTAQGSQEEEACKS